MAGEIDSVVTVTITRQTTTPTIASFDSILIVAEFLKATPTPDFNTRTKTYTSLTTLGTEFGTTSVVYLRAAAMKAQNPSISSWVVGRKLTGGDGSETWTTALTAILAENPNWYGINAATYTLAEQELIADWAESNEKLYGVDSGDPNIPDSTGDIAEYLNTNNYDRSYCMYHINSNEENIVDIVYDADFVALNSIEIVVNSTSVVTVFDTDQDTTMDNIITNIEANATLNGISATLTDEDGDNRSLQLYWNGIDLTVTSTVTLGASQAVATITESSADEFPAIAWMGEVFPYDPGESNWAFKTLTGITSYSLTGAQKTTIEGKECNFYNEISGIDVTRWGTVGSGEYIDIIRGTDWLKARIQQRVFTPLTQLRKIPFTDAGVQIVVSELRGALQEGVDRGLLAEGSIEIDYPAVADVSVADKANRLLPDVEFRADYAGAINKTEINGIISL
ncbi:MAG: DUF3383 family protein [Candidatus Hodarchaeota archaeon]